LLYITLLTIGAPVPDRGDAKAELVRKRPQLIVSCRVDTYGATLVAGHKPSAGGSPKRFNLSVAFIGHEVVRRKLSLREATPEPNAASRPARRADLLLVHNVARLQDEEAPNRLPSKDAHATPQRAQS
jgi:hypothetical protein